MGCEMEKIRVSMNKPVYLGQVILDLRKIIMYEFHYDYMFPKYGNNIKLCYMDTDSFIYDIKTEDFYKNISNNVESRFNTSGYMTKFVALRPKLYAFKMLSGSGDKKCKGVKKYSVMKTLNFNDYKQCLLAGREAFRKQLLFQNELHGVHMVEVNKLALSRDDNKQVIQSDGVSTLAHRHNDAQ